MNIRTKLWFGIGVAIIIAVLVGTVLLATFSHVHHTIDRIQDMNRIMKSVIELKIITTDYQASGLERTRSQWMSLHDTLHGNIAGFDGPPEHRAILQRMQDHLASLKDTFDLLQELSWNGGVTEPSDASLSISHRLMAKMDATLLKLYGDANQLVSLIHAAMLQGQRMAMWIVGLSAFTMLALIVGLATMVSRTTIRPLLRLGASTAIIGAGDLAHRTGMTANDEVGALSRSFDAMLDRLNAVMASRDELNREVAQRQRAETRLRRALANLTRSNQDLEQFAYSASHDLQEPLRKVMAFGSLLEKEYGANLEGDGHLYLASIGKATLRMQTLINDLLSYSRVTTRGKTFVAVNLNAVVGEVLSDLEVRIGETNAQVNVGDLPEIQADPTQMRQLVQNLIGNALKFHKPDEHPVITVSAEAVADAAGQASGSPATCRLQIKDNGIGFDEKYLERIFGVFQRLHGRDEYGGSGIGLAVCRKIVERHGGTITATSQPGEGATFTVILPLKHTDEEADAEKEG